MQAQIRERKNVKNVHRLSHIIERSHNRLLEICKANRTELILFFLALAAYLPGIGWGLPHATGPDRVYVWAYDDISPLPALTEVYQTLVQAGPNPWLAYPLMHHFVVVAAYAPYLAWLFLTGQLESPGPIYPYGMRDPVASLQVLAMIARLVSCFMAAGIVVIAYRIGVTLWGKKEGILASIICLSSYPMFYYSKTANLEIPYLFWTSLGLLIYAKILVSGLSVKRAILLAAFAAMAAATKDQAAGLFLLLPLILVPVLIKEWKAKRVSLWSPTSAFLAAGCLVYALGSGLAFNPDRYFAHVDFILYKNRELMSDYIQWYPFTFSGILGLKGEFLKAQVWIKGPILVAAAGVALVHSGRLQLRKFAFLLPAVSYLLTIILPMQYLMLRYVLPVTFILAIFSGRGLAMGLSLVSRSRLASSLIIIIALAWPFSLSFDLTLQMWNDSRYEAEKWLSTNMAENGRVGYLGSVNMLPRLRAETQIVSLPKGVAAFDYLQADGPDIMISVSDWSNVPGMQKEKELYERLKDGSLGYRLAASFDKKFFINRQSLDIASVNPPLSIFVKSTTP